MSSGQQYTISLRNLSYKGAALDKPPTLLGTARDDPKLYDPPYSIAETHQHYFDPEV
jgi:hypothetical protein